MSPSGKAPGSGPGIRGFESLHPSHENNSRSVKISSYFHIVVSGIRTGLQVCKPRHFRRLIDGSESLHPSHDKYQMVPISQEDYNKDMTDKVLYQCPECGLHYEDIRIAQQCEAFCKEYNGCSLEITKLSVERSSTIKNLQ